MDDLESGTELHFFSFEQLLLVKRLFFNQGLGVDQIAEQTGLPDTTVVEILESGPLKDAEDDYECWASAMSLLQEQA